jgi:pyruvyltransferase
MMTGIGRFCLNNDALVTTENGDVPLIYWPVAPNFGDLLSPWLFAKITGRAIRPCFSRPLPINKLRHFDFQLKDDSNLRRSNYISIGSIISRARDTSIVWGTGSFGTEQISQLSKGATYHAVRGPLTRQLLKNADIVAPEVYGDPALLTPLLFTGPKTKTHDIGIVLRWSEKDWTAKKVGDGVKIIDLGSSDVEQTLNEILSCRRIVTSSLHGLIIADSYGIPNAYLASETPKGGIFKYLDYFASVDKFRLPKPFDFKVDRIDIDHLEKTFTFDDRKIKFDSNALLRSCPFISDGSLRAQSS